MGQSQFSIQQFSNFQWPQRNAWLFWVRTTSRPDSGSLSWLIELLYVNLICWLTKNLWILGIGWWI